MTVRIARLRSGEDVIADIREVTKKDDEQDRALAFQFIYPYNVDIQDKLAFLVEGMSDSPIDIQQPSLILYPWMPLSAQKEIFVRLDEVVSIYEPHTAVTEKYYELLEARIGGKPEGTIIEERDLDTVPSGGADGDGRGTESAD